jgi:hypothetical protein
MAKNKSRAKKRPVAKAKRTVAKTGIAKRGSGAVKTMAFLNPAKKAKKPKVASPGRRPTPKVVGIRPTPKVKVKVKVRKSAVVKKPATELPEKPRTIRKYPNHPM